MIPFNLYLYNYQQLYDLILEYQLCKSRLRPNNTAFDFFNSILQKSIRSVITDKDTKNVNINR